MPHELKLIKSTEEFRLLEPVWNDLLSQSPSNNFFLTWEWLWNWWQVYARPGDKLSIFVIDKENEISAIAPFYVRKRRLHGIYPVRRMMFLGTQEEGDGDVGSDYMDIIYRDGEEKSFIHAFFAAIAEYDMCDEIYFSKMDVSARTYDLIRNESAGLRFLSLIANEYVSPYIQLPSTWDDYLKSLSSSMRWNIRNEQRKLQNCPHVVFRKTSDPVELVQDFDELVKLHENRWSSNGIEGAFSNEKFTLFHKNIMKCISKRELVLFSISF